MDEQSGTAATADADIVRAGRVLVDYFTDFEVDSRLLRQILAAHPDLARTAATWGWSDTEVRGELAQLLAQALLCRPWPTFGTAAADPSFDDDLIRAQQCWISSADARPPGSRRSANASPRAWEMSRV